MPEPSLFAIVRSWRRGILVWLMLFTADVGLLWVSGAFHSEFGEYPDEPSHYVTGLMVRDYIASLAASPPMRFAENYYVHYPKVALGHYPPFLYMVEAAWMLVFPVSRTSLLLLNAILTSLAATLLSLLVRKEFGAWAGAGAGFLFVALPLIQISCGMVMAEPLTLCLTFGAVICYGRYLETERWSWAAWFGVLASLAILTKQVALFLALVPPIALLLTRKFRLLRRSSFWLPALIVTGLAAPWYLFAGRYFSAKLTGLAGYPLEPSPLSGQAALFIAAGGWALTMPFAAGLWARVIRPPLRSLAVQGRWAAYAGSIGGFLLFQRVAPAANEARHLVSIAPAILLFVAAGIAWMALGLSRLGLKPAWAATALSLLVGLAFGLETFKLPQRRYHGFAEAASRLSADPQFHDDVMLICSNSSGEGAFIAEVAQRENRPGHIILRGNKLLSVMTWTGTQYHSFYKTPGDLLKFLESVPVKVLVLETAAGRPRTRHEELADEMVRLYPDRWRLVSSYPRLRAASAPGAVVRVYRLIGHEDKPRSKIRIDLRRRLGRFVEN